MQARGRFISGQSGNPRGKPKGARNHTTRRLDALAAGAGEQIVQDLIARAAQSDAAAAMILARIWPVPRGRTVMFQLPPIATAVDAAGAMAAILEAAARGEVTPDEAATLASVLERYGKLIELTEMQQRIAALERAAAVGGEQL